MFLPRLRLLFATVGLFAAAALAAAEPAMIAKARAALGTEAALGAIRALRFTGKVDDGAGHTAEVEIIFQRPYRQRITVRAAGQIEVNALDGYDGWRRLEDPKNSANWRVTLLDKGNIKRLRANVWENFAYFRGIEKGGGRVEDRGDETVDGVPCQKLAFIHAPDIIFYRSFDKASGRLLLTETEAGISIRERGEMIVKGVRFPKTIVNTTKNKDGTVTVATVTFDTITLDEALPDSLFKMPALRAQ